MNTNMWFRSFTGMAILLGFASTAPAQSCAGHCGDESSGCWCDTECTSFGDCCSDYYVVCVAPAPGSDDSCMGNCGQSAGDCWCDEQCTEYADCCPDYDAVCVAAAPGSDDSCMGNCGESASNCWCDDQCIEYEDCCPDYYATCAPDEEFYGVAALVELLESMSGSIWEQLECVETVFEAYQNKIFGEKPDKWRHCYASCRIARECGALPSGLLGALKELKDLVGTIGYNILSELPVPSWMVDLSEQLKGDPDPEDLVADGMGIVCGYGPKSCMKCCNVAYP